MNQTVLVEKIQTLIKLAIRDSVLRNEPFNRTSKKINEIINSNVKDIDPEIRDKISQGFYAFASKAYKQFIIDLGMNPKILVATVLLMRKGTYLPKDIAVLNTNIMQVEGIMDTGLANQEYHGRYIERVKTALNNLRKIEAKEYGSNVSLRNISEMQVRYEKHQQELTSLVEKGKNLVMSSTHSNCSERCQPWQGRYYTLDGTYQTVDGKEFIPLENATDVYVTTKAGKVYKNGLLGFNCRHKIIAYEKGLKIPHEKESVILKQRAIDKRMRELERHVRSWKEEALLNKGVDNKRYQYSKNKANQWNDAYINFAKANDRAYYPDRIKII